MIGFIGTVFSPWYVWSGRGDPADHVCLNVTTAGPGGRFTMTDRGRAALRRSPGALGIGPSRMAWEDGRLVIDIDEWGAPPVVLPVRGRVVLTPAAVTGVEVALTPDGAHVWRPFAPVARIDVDLGRPGWRWSGHGYFDANFGTRPLEADFSHWTWARYSKPGGTVCHYHGLRSDGTPLSLSLNFGPDGAAEPVDLPPAQPLPGTIWALARETCADPGTRPRVVLPMLDGPFYNRAIVATTIGGAAATGVHETLDLRRYSRGWVRAMVATRVPRWRSWWRGGPGTPPV